MTSIRIVRGDCSVDEEEQFVRKIILSVLLVVLAFYMVGCLKIDTPPTSDGNSSTVYQFTPVEPITDGGNYSAIKQ